MRRVVVTGVGVISPVGNTAEVFFHNLAAGRSGIRRISSDFANALEVKVAAESTFSGEDHFSKKQLGILDRASQMALAAASLAFRPRTQRRGKAALRRLPGNGHGRSEFAR